MLTENEEKVLDHVRDEAPMDSEETPDVADAVGLSVNEAKGVLSSLKKKGHVKMENMVINGENFKVWTVPE